MIELRQTDFDDCFPDPPPATADPSKDLARAQRAGRARTHRRIVATAVTLTAAAAVAVLAPGWRGEPQLAVPAGPATSAGQLPSWRGCTASGAFDDPDFSVPPPQARVVPTDFTAVKVRRCTQEVRRAQNGDDVRVHVEQEAPATPAFLAYLAQPSVPHKDHVLCPADGVMLPWLVLVDQDGRYVTPSLPTDECSKPLQYDDPGGAPYNTLDYHDVSADEVDVVNSRAAREAGCPMANKNMFVYESAAPTTASIDPGLFANSSTRRCEYRVDPASSDSGIFTSGGPITGTELTALLNTATRATPRPGASTCSASASRFTVISTTNGRPGLYIENDGCRRILLGN